MTDLDRLHRVVTLQVGGRQCGRTFAACHTLAGMVCTVPKRAIIVWPLRHGLFQIEYIRPMLGEVLLEHGIPFTWARQRELIANGRRVRFVSEQDRLGMRGASYCVSEPEIPPDRGRIQDFMRSKA